MDFNLEFIDFCIENDIKTKLSFDMPNGYETAFGTYDCTNDTIYINKEILETYSPVEKIYFLYHELRHAVQYTHRELFSDEIQESLNYVILYDGTCFKLINSEWKQSKLSGEESFFLDVYKSLPYEVEANQYAYHKVIKELGDSDELFALYDLFKPKKYWEYEKLKELFLLIDQSLV